MLVIGLTGGIGCGKSTTCSFFSELGIPVIDTDELAKNAVQRNSKCLEKLTGEFGADILQPDNSLDRAKLRKLVFSNQGALSKLEAILHPEIRRQLTARLTQLNEIYVIVDIPLLLEKNWQTVVDRILVIDCPVELQLSRTLKRDKDNENGIRRIINTQVSRKQRLEAADDVIINDSSLEAVKQQVEKLHLYYTQLASRRI